MTHKTFVVIDGVMVTGDAAKIQALVEFYVASKIEKGSGAVMERCSEDLNAFMDRLHRRYPQTGRSRQNS